MKPLDDWPEIIDMGCPTMFCRACEAFCWDTDDATRAAFYWAHVWHLIRPRGDE